MEHYHVLLGAPENGRAGPIRRYQADATSTFLTREAANAWARSWPREGRIVRKCAGDDSCPSPTKAAELVPDTEPPWRQPLPWERMAPKRRRPKPTKQQKQIIDAVRGELPPDVLDRIEALIQEVTT